MGETCAGTLAKNGRRAYEQDSSVNTTSDRIIFRLIHCVQMTENILFSVFLQLLDIDIVLNSPRVIIPENGRMSR